MNHTRFPKEKHLPYWARRGNKDKKGDRVELVCITRIISCNRVLLENLIVVYLVKKISSFNPKKQYCAREICTCTCRIKLLNLSLSSNGAWGWGAQVFFRSVCETSVWTTKSHQYVNDVPPHPFHFLVQRCEPMTALPNWQSKDICWVCERVRRSATFSYESENHCDSSSLQPRWQMEFSMARYACLYQGVLYCPKCHTS